MSINKETGMESSHRADDMGDIRQLVETAIDESLAAVDALENDPNETNAEDACLACRTATQLFVFARGDFGESATQRTDVFRDVLERAYRGCERVGKLNGQGSPAWKYKDNLRLRQELIDAVIANNSAAFRRLVKSELLRAT